MRSRKVVKSRRTRRPSKRSRASKARARTRRARPSRPRTSRPRTSRPRTSRARRPSRARSPRRSPPLSLSVRGRERFQRDTFNNWKPNYSVWKCESLTNDLVEQNFDDFVNEILFHSSLHKDALTHRPYNPTANKIRENFYTERTIGSDNDCLIHSVLTICSPAFRLQNDNVKVNVASFFRRNILTQMPGFTPEEIALLQGRNFLDSDILTKIANCFKVSFCVFLTYDNTVQLLNTENQNDYYLISNNGGSTKSGSHFEAAFKMVDQTRIYKIPHDQGNSLALGAWA